MRAAAVKLRTKRRWTPPYEMAQCTSLMEWVNLQLIVFPELQMLFHIPNEGKRTKFVGHLMRRMGLKRGVWDYFLPVPRDYGGAFVPGLWIEMKRPGEELTTEQAWWGAQMEKLGYATFIAYSWVTAKEALCGYLANDAITDCKRRH